MKPLLIRDVVNVDLITEQLKQISEQRQAATSLST